MIRASFWARAALLALPTFGCHPASPCPVTAVPAAASAAPPTPSGPRAVVRQTNYLLETGALALEVDATDGGRTVSFSFAGRNVIASREESSEAYGSSFWPSPQSDWGWPPPANFDKHAWRAHIDGPALVLESGTDPKLGLSAQQRITADSERGSFRFELTLFNHGPSARRVAGWQNTRMRPNGLTFFPSRTPLRSDLQHEIAPRGGLIWFQHDPSARTQGEKFFDDGEDGWLAHLDGDLLFVKAFPDVPAAGQAPKEAEIELYADGKGQFVEVEQQGPFTEISPGGQASWVVDWIVRPLPPGVGKTAFDPTLADFARGLVEVLRGPLVTPAKK